MSNTLITKLSSSVSASGLSRLGELRFHSRTSDKPVKIYVQRISASVAGKIRIEGNAHFTNAALTEDYGQEINLDTSTTSQTFYITAGDYYLFIPQKYYLTSMTFYLDTTFGSVYTDDPGLFEMCDSLTSLTASGIAGSGLGYFLDIGKIGDESLETLISSSRSFKGDIATLKSKSTIKKFNYYSGDIVGDISAFAGNTAMTELVSENSGMVGDIASLAGNKSLTMFGMPKSNVYGNANDLLDGMYAAGRTSGSCTLSFYGTGPEVYLNGSKVAIKVIDFSANGWTVRS